MRDHLITSLFTCACLAAAAAGIVAFATITPNRDISRSLPGMDGAEARAAVADHVTIGENFQRFPTTDPETAAPDYPWPGFRGPRRDNIADDATTLPHDWPPDGPPVRWRVPLGEGYAAPVVARKRVYVLDYLEEEGADALRCFALDDGRELWRRSYRNDIRRNHGKSRTVPAVAADTVVTIGPKAHVMAVDAISGDLLWSRDMIRQDGTEIPQWYTGQCPLIDGDRVILAPAGADALLHALNLRTGDLIWSLPNTIGLNMSHSSVMITTMHGVKQYVYAGLGGMVGVSPDGELLWSSRDWQPPVWAPSPVQVGTDRLFLTAGYGMGSALLQLTRSEDGWHAALLGKWKPTLAPASEQQTPIFHHGLLFTIQPKDAGARRAQLVAADPGRLPNIVASSGRELRFGLGPFLLANDKFWILDDDGHLSIVAFQDNAFTLLGRYRVLPGVDSWGPIALAGDLLLVRDSTSMACLELQKTTP